MDYLPRVLCITSFIVHFAVAAHTPSIPWPNYYCDHLRVGVFGELAGESKVRGGVPYCAGLVKANLSWLGFLGRPEDGDGKASTESWSWSGGRHGA